MHDVFLSYAQPDSEAAIRVARHLEANGLRVFMDRTSLVAGESFQQNIAREIAEAGAVVVLLSANSRRSSWVEKDLTQALERNQLVVPVLLDEGAKDNWVWPLLSNRTAIELRGDPRGWNEGLSALSRAVGAGVGPAVATRRGSASRLRWTALVALAVVVALTSIWSLRLVNREAPAPGPSQLIELFARTAEAAMTTPAGPSREPEAPVTNRLEFTRPDDGSEVPQVTILEGTIRDTVDVWIVVHPLDTSSYWVQPQATSSGGRWSTLAFFGRSGDVDAGKTFEVRAFIEPTVVLREGEVLREWPAARGVSAPLTLRRLPATR